MLKRICLSSIFLLLIMVTTNQLSAQTRYPGKKHSTSHGGKYSGGRGSSHKGGHYKNTRTSNNYGRHKH